MWEDMDSRSRKKSKGQRLFSNGVVVLVCLILAAQAVFFGKYLIDSRRAMREQRQEERQASQDNIQDNTPGQEGLSITGQGGSSSRRTGRTSYDGQPGRTSSSTAAARAGSTSDNHPSERTFSTVSASTPASAAGSSPHTDSIRDSDSARNTDSSRNSRNGYSPTRSYSHDGWSWDLVELNSADSAALDALPGIGPYYARQILAYRERLGFYADISQLLDIRGMDTARLRRLADRLYIAPESLRPLDLYSMPLDSLAAHPYIGPYAAKGIDRLRRTLPEAEFTFRTILDSKILPEAQARRLALYFPEAEEP